MDISSEVVSVYARAAVECLDYASTLVNRLIADCDSADNPFVFYVLVNRENLDGVYVVDVFETEAEAIRMATAFRARGRVARVMMSRERF